MRKARIYNFGLYAGDLIEVDKKKKYKFIYNPEYAGTPVSLTMPVQKQEYEFENFPPFFEGVLPEGMQLDALLRITKTDRDDLFAQLILVGEDLVGSVTVEQSE